MSKSILMIDKPENCRKCPCFRRNIDNIPEEYCFDGLIKREIVDLSKKPDWCQLRDFPEKKPRIEYRGNGCFGINESTKNSFNMGFNSCIDEILKGDGQG